MKSKFNPASTKQWTEFYKSLNGDQIVQKKYAMINRFLARYRLARSFQGFHLNGYSAKITSGYSCIFHVHLAFSAFECLLKGIKSSGFEMNWDKNEHNHKFINQVLADKIRSNKKLIDLLLTNLDAKLLKDKIQNFNDSKCDNLAPVVKGVRNLVAHGELSATGAVAGSTKHIKSLHDLAMLVLDDVDQIFYDFSNKITSQQLVKVKKI